MSTLTRILTIIILCVSATQGFMPDKAGIYTPGNTVTHAKQTELEIHAFLNDHFGITEAQITTTMKNARDSIIKANKFVDDSAGTEKDDGKAHFDDELFEDGQARLMDLRGQMITALQNGNAESARDLFGRQLHGLQDFYAHSNWVEMGNTVISDVIGWPGETGYQKTPLSLDTCHLYCQDFSAVSLNSYLRSLDCLNSCKKGDQTTWELFESYACVKISPTCHVYDCSGNLIAGGNQVTSGYYLTEGGAGEKPSPGKCSHGGLNDKGAKGTEGINKDSEWELYAPHGLPNSWHQKAAGLARQATQRYLQQLTIDWPEIGQPALTERELKLLLGIGSAPLVFVIDTTGSMGDVIASVQNTAAEIVDSLEGTAEEPISYTLMGYNDPAGTDIISTTDASIFITQLDNLFAFGGGDCPEPALAALITTLDVIDDDSIVFLFTDAKDKDPENFNTVINAAVDKEVRLNFFLFPSLCSDGSSYALLAEGTSGAFIELPDRTGAQDLVTTALQLIQPDNVDLYADYPTAAMSASAVRRAAETVSILVDSTMKTLTFRSAGTATLTITRPDSSVVKVGDAGVSYLATPATSFVTITAPAVGTWMVTRSDTTSGTSISVIAGSTLTFNRFEFVEIRGVHPAWFPIDETSLIAGTEYTVNADVEGSLAIDHFEFRSAKNGDVVLLSFDMTRVNDTDGLPPDHLWYANVTVPCGAFYAYVFGKDDSGVPFQRFVPKLFNTTASCSGNTTATTSVSSSTPPLHSSGTGYPAHTSGTGYHAHTSGTGYHSHISGTGYHAHTSAASGRWNSTLSLIAPSTSVTDCGQGVPMTKTVVVLSTLTTCLYTTTVPATPCTGKTTCGAGSISTYSVVSFAPYTTTTVLVPIPGASVSVSASKAPGSLAPVVMPTTAAMKTAGMSGSSVPFKGAGSTVGIGGGAWMALLGAIVSVVVIAWVGV